MYKLPGFSRIMPSSSRKKMHQKSSRLPVHSVAKVTTLSRQTKVTFAMMDYDMMSSTDSSTDFEDVLEKKIEDLSRQLTEERQLARKEKQTVARLHREIARHRGDKENKMGKDSLMKDMERERMLRIAAEKQLKEMTVESNNCRTRLMALQEEFHRMEEVVKNMMQYKSKIDQLKQEKSSLSITYENNILKYRSHISTLERENIVLMNDVKKFESQITGKVEGQSQHLMDRLRVLEAENATLVHENEHQRLQYEKCLDEIANQVVQALLAQKALREECLKLQNKVQDLEYQNHELNTIFQHNCPPEARLQITESHSESSSMMSENTSLPTSQSQFSSAMALTQTMHLSPMSQYVLQTMVAQKCFGNNSAESLQNMCSEYTCDSSVGKPQMSTPVWSENKNGKPVSKATKNSSQSVDHVNRRTKIETEFPATNSSPKMKHVSILEKSNQRGEKSLSTSSLPTSDEGKRAKTKSLTSLSKSKIALPSGHKTKTAPSGMCLQREGDIKERSLSHPDQIHKVMTSSLDNSVLRQSRRGSAGKIVTRERSSSSSSLHERIGIRERSSSAASAIPIKKGQSSKVQKTTPKPLKKSKYDGNKASSDSISSSSSSLHSPKPESKSPVPIYAKISPSHKVMTSDHKVKEKMSALKQSLGNPPRVPLLPNAQYFYDYSDEDSDFNRPTSCNLSNASTMSLNEVLDDDEDTDTLLDEEFCAEKFAFFDSPSFVKKCEEHSKKNSANKKIESKDMSNLRGKPDIVKDTEYSEFKNQNRSPHIPRKRNSLQHHKTKRIQGNPRPSSLILAPREKHFLYQGYSSSSSSIESSDSDENWSPRFARKHYNAKQLRAKPCVSQQQFSSPSPEIIPRKNSVGDITCNSKDKSSPLLANSPVSPLNVNVMTSSTESNSANSLTRKKGPPPPVPKKPLTGRRSPGIKMGLQSPGFRHNKNQTVVSELKNINLSIKPHELRSDNINQNKQPEYQESQTGVRYVNSELSFDNVKVDKVERSGSKDDGYSTMSSDIQPEAMEKFSDASLQKKEACVTVKEISIKSEQPVTSEVKVSKSGVDVTSDPDSAMDSSTHSTEMRNSNHSISSQNSSSSEDRATSYGSLGRVKAMKLLFEAENEKQADFKSGKFPLRKSPSVDSKLGCNRELRILNRRSLGDDSKMFASAALFHKVSEDPLQEVGLSSISTSREKSLLKQNIQCVDMCDTEIPAPPLLHDASPSVTTSTMYQHVQMLNISEENFLSDIPEEKDEWDASTHSCEKLLENSLKSLQSSTKYYAHLQLLQSLTVKNHWSSMEGLAREVTHHEFESKVKGMYDVDDIMGFDSNNSKPLERSKSLSDLHQRNSNERVKVVPKLIKVKVIKEHKSCDLSDIQRVQATLKDQILKQLAHTVESESDEDQDLSGFHSLISQGHVTYSGQGQQGSHRQIAVALPQHTSSHPASSSSGIPPHNSTTSVQSSLQESSVDMESLPDEEGRFSDQGRQFSSKENSPFPEEQTQKTGKFRSDYYSLCTVGSNKSLFSGSNEGECDPLPPQPPVHTCTEEDMSECSACTGAKNSTEFDEISRQLENLSKTVNALHKSLTSLNSCDSDNESNEDHTPLCPPPESGSFGDNEGYQWVEDEIYLTPCGGEIIMGTSPFSETGACVDWVNEYADDTSCNDEFEFYGNFDPDEHTNVKETRRAYSPIHEEQDPKEPMGAGEVFAPPSHVTKHLAQRQVSSDQEHEVFEPKAQAASLDSMVHLSGASMDSLDDNIGVDHVMCSRLLGRGDKNPGQSSGNCRTGIDFSKFFLRFGNQEEEAVAAFDFLNEFSTSPENNAVDHLPYPSHTNTSQSDQSDHSSHADTSKGQSGQSSQVNTSVLDQSTSQSQKGTLNKDKETNPVHVNSQPLTTSSGLPHTKQTQGLASDSDRKKSVKEMNKHLFSEIQKSPQVSAPGQYHSKTGPTPKTSIPKVPQNTSPRHGAVSHNTSPKLGIQGSLNQVKSEGRPSALKQAMGLAEGKPLPTWKDGSYSMKASEMSKSCEAPGKPLNGASGSNSVPASPKPSRIGFFRRKISDKKGGNEEKPSKLPKKSTVGAKEKEKEKEKDKSKIPKAVKQEQNSTKLSRKFLQRTSSSSSSKSSSSTKGGNS